uniref:Putative secreted protein n=1 Tax=Amblyomma americanum TaxID=6943 RepID=A0A0C9SEQ0_AMBAM
MSSHVALPVTIFGIILLHAIVVCFSRPQITSRSNNTTEPEISLESCNQTCNPSQHVACCDGCICFLRNNDTEGHCYQIVGLDYEYGSLNMSSLDAYTPIPPVTNS